MAAVGTGSKKPVALYLKLLATINYYVRLECQGDLSLALSHHLSPMSVGRARVDTDFAEKPLVRTSNAFEARQREEDADYEERRKDGSWYEDSLLGLQSLLRYAGNVSLPR